MEETAMDNVIPGRIVPESCLVNVKSLVEAYYANRPDPECAEEQVTFGTSGHRGVSFQNSFTETHILAITQAVCDYRKQAGITGPLFLGMDTHALSAPAHKTALEVLTGNEITVVAHSDERPTPTPLISFSILRHNASSDTSLADGIVVTPSHNPPEHGGFKYNPPHGGPAESKITGLIQQRANQIMRDGLKDVKRLPYERAIRSSFIRWYDYLSPYVSALPEVVDMASISASGLHVAADALGGSSAELWQRIAEQYRLNMTVLNAVEDPRFSFMPADSDGQIRMDCSSPWAMAGLLAHKDHYDLAFGNDPDADRHGIVTPSGLMQPNHYLACCVEYLFSSRLRWSDECSVGKTIVSSAMLDKVAARLGRRIYETPVGFKWFVSGLLDGWCGFAGEESAGASFLRINGGVWSTDKDGIIPALLAVEMTAVSSIRPDRLYAGLERELGKTWYRRVDEPADAALRSKLGQACPHDVQRGEVAGSPITGILTAAPGNGASIGGLKVTTGKGWFAARPSGTEPIFKIYAESFVGEEHLDLLLVDAKTLVNELLAK